MNALAAQPPAKMPLPERKQYMAFTSIVRVLAAGESHSIERLIPVGNRLADERAEAIRRLVQYGAATRAGEVVSGVIKRAGRLLRNEAEFCEVGAFNASHAEDMQVVIDNGTDVLIRAQALVRVHAVMEAEALVHRLDVSKNYLYMLLAYAEVTPEARAALEAHGMIWRYAYSLRRCPPEQQVAVVKYFAENDVTVPESSRAGMLASVLETLGSEPVALPTEQVDPNALSDESVQSITVAAARVGVNRRTVYDWIYRGTIQASEDAVGVKLVRVADLARALKDTRDAAVERDRAQVAVLPNKPAPQDPGNTDDVSEKELLETSVRLSMATLRAVELLTELVTKQQAAIDFLSTELGYKK